MVKMFNYHLKIEWKSQFLMGQMLSVWAVSVTGASAFIFHGWLLFSNAPSENPILQYDLLFKGCGVNLNFSVLQLKQSKASKFLQLTIHSVCFSRPRAPGGRRLTHASHILRSWIFWIWEIPHQTKKTKYYSGGEKNIFSDILVLSNLRFINRRTVALRAHFTAT